MPRSPTPNQRVIVVGAGIAGLTAAFRCQAAGCDVTVLEAADHAGGRMSSMVRDGFIQDAGANTLTRRYRQMLQLAHDAGIGHKVVPTPGLTGIPRDGRMHRLPDNIIKGAGTRLLSPRSKLSLANVGIDGVRLSRRFSWDALGLAAEYDAETVQQYADRRVTAEVRDWVLDPIVRGCYLSQVDEMPAIEFMFLVVNFIGSKLFTFEGGVGALVAALAERVDVRLNARVTSTEDRGPETVVTWNDRDGVEHIEHADHTVIALSAHDMAAVHPQLATEDRRIVDGLEYIRMLRITLALDRRPAEPATFVGIPTTEHPDLASLFIGHNQHPDRAPAGKGLITTLWTNRWNTEHWEDSDDDLADASLSALRQVLPDAGDLLFGDITRWENAVIRSRVGTYRALFELGRRRTEAKRIHLAGDYFGGSTTNSALCSGEFAARQVLARSLFGSPAGAAS